VIKSIPLSRGIIGSGISFACIFGNYDSRNSSSFCFSVIATSPLFLLTVGVVDKALSEVYFRAVQHLFWLFIGSSFIVPCRNFCQHILFTFRSVV
jgi:hypothetical protein